MSELSSFFTEKAKINFGEDESRKSQSLAQFREWISKHPFIKRCNPTDAHLLAHLRCCKYSMTNAFEQFEKCLVFIKTHEDWFKLSDEDYERALQLYEAGFIKIMKKRDAEGRRNAVFTSSLGDPNKFNGDDVMNLQCILFPMLISEEETQICGMNYINSCKNTTVSHLSLLSMKKSFDALTNLKVFPLSVKNIIIIGVPQFAAQAVNMMKYLLTDKMKKRFHVVNDVSELDDESVKAAFNDDCGDKEVENIRELVKTYSEYYKILMDFDIDMEKASASKNVKSFENVGSFRKLEID
ncbi:alpha-tocopherol transfer protein-like [Chironomus tepperi]|uniref:alpha-tocopherol transfer protein-like n=1 Tax=Chironomus tepperi TaxID=113505 RepID=UPI00391F9F21